MEGGVKFVVEWTTKKSNIINLAYYKSLFWAKKKAKKVNGSVKLIEWGNSCTVGDYMSCEERRLVRNE